MELPNCPLTARSILIASKSWTALLTLQPERTPGVVNTRLLEAAHFVQAKESGLSSAAVRFAPNYQERTRNNVACQTFIEKVTFSSSTFAYFREGNGKYRSSPPTIFNLQNKYHYFVVAEYS